MRLSSTTALLALALSSSALLAQADDHAAHHPPAAAPAPEAKAPAQPDDKPCPMMNGMKSGDQKAMQGNMSGPGEHDMRAMQEKMKACMAAKDKDSGGSADQHQH